MKEAYGRGPTSFGYEEVMREVGPPSKKVWPLLRFTLLAFFYAEMSFLTGTSQERVGTLSTI